MKNEPAPRATSAGAARAFSRKGLAAFVGLLLVAALARLLFLGSVPDGVFHDEAEKGYSAYSLLRTGGVFDFTPPDRGMLALTFQKVLSTPGVPLNAALPYEPGWQMLPFFRNVWGSTTSMIYQYGALPWVALGGLNVWTLRLPAALAGLGTVLALFFLARRMDPASVSAWAALFFLALSPWHLVFSRWAQQGVFVPFFLTLSLLAFQKALHHPKPAPFLRAAIVAYGLAFYSYQGARPFLLLFALWGLWVYRHPIRAHWQRSLRLGLLAAVVLAPSFWAMLAGGAEGMGRFQQLSVFGGDGTWWAKGWNFLKNYAVHFSPAFLFWEGDALPRHQLPGCGVLGFGEGALFLAGLVRAIRRGNRRDRLVLGWLLCSPVSAALTNEGLPHALRMLHGVPAFALLAGQGFGAVWHWAGRQSRQRCWRAGLMVALLLNGFYVLAQLFGAWPRDGAPWFEQGLHEAFTENSATHWHIQVGPELPYIPELYAFHLKPDPRRLGREGFQVLPFTLYPPGTAPERVLGRMAPGHGLLCGRRDYLQGYQKKVSGPAYGTQIIRRPQPFLRPEPGAALYSVKRK